MRRLAFLSFGALLLVALGCGNNQNTGTNTDTTTTTATSADSPSGSTAGFKIGIQMWTFRMFPFADALNKVDSAGVKNIEPFFGQELGGGMKGYFDNEMSPD